MPDLDGKVAIVTGAAVGIGREVAVSLGRQHAQVVVNFSKSQGDAERTAELVEQAGGVSLVAHADVADDAQVQAMVDKTLARFGRVDVLVNNAGVTVKAPFTDLDAMTDAVWDHLYAVNVKGTFYCCRAVADVMRRQGAGKIINLGSVAGIRPTGSSIAYCAAKAAVIHVSKCLAKALAPEIRVNVLVPGFIDDTRWNADIADLDGLRSSAIDGTPLGRVGHPGDIAEAAAWLAGGADFLTGAVIVIDGGRQFTQ